MDSKDKVSELEDWSKAMEERFKDPLSAELISILVTMLKEIKAGAEFESNKMDQNDAKVKKFCDLERKLIEAMKELNKKAEIFDADKDDGYSTKETGKALDAKAQLLAGVGEDVNGNKVDNYDANVKLLEQCLNQENCCDSGRKLMEQMKEINKTADKDDGYSTNETGKAMEAKTQLLAGEDNGNKVDKYDANVKLLEQCINQHNCCDLGRKLMEQMKEINKTADKDDGYSTKETGNAMEAKAQFLAGWARYGEPTFGEMSADGFCCIM